MAELNTFQIKCIESDAKDLNDESEKRRAKANHGCDEIL